MWISRVSGGLTNCNRKLLIRLSWKRHMVDILNEDGFKDVQLLKVEYDLTMARFWNDV